MSSATAPSMILNLQQDPAGPSARRDDSARVTADLRVRFAAICGIALATFALLWSVDNVVARKHFVAGGDLMVIERAHAAALTASMAAQSGDDHGPAARRALATAATDIRSAVAKVQTLRGSVLASVDHRAFDVIARELSLWADRVEILAVAQGGPDVRAARSALQGIGNSDLLPCLDALAAQADRRALLLGRAKVGLRVLGLLIISVALMAIWTSVIRPMSMRQQSVLKRLRRNEYAARELAAKAAQADEAKANFLSVISHELRTPMNGILGCAELIRVGAHDERERVLAATICDSGADLMAIVTDILDFTDMKSGEFELFAGVVDAEQLVDDVKAKFAGPAQAARARLEVALLGDPERTRQGDMARMTQILSNLTDNAVRFTQGGAVFVTIDNRFARTLTFTIRDTGVGMTAPEVARAFAPFSQADAGETRLRGGAGMGLAIVKKLVDAMGGDVRLQSRAGAGTTVTVAVPLPFSEGANVGTAGLPPLTPKTSSMKKLRLNAA